MKMVTNKIAVFEHVRASFFFTAIFLFGSPSQRRKPPQKRNTGGQNWATISTSFKYSAHTI